MKMYNPCLECQLRHGHSYTEECDNKCQYAYQLSRLKPYGTLDEIVEVLKGDRFPVVFLDKDHIDSTFAIVSAAKEGLI
jgi:hypothetical protein